MIHVTFDELFTFENIYKAHIKGRISKRTKRPIVRYELNLFEKLAQLHIRLHDDTKPQMFKYHSFTVFEPKLREIQTLHYSDRVIQHVLCDNVIAPYFTKRAILDNGVCQKDKGTHFTLARFEKKLRQFARKHGQNGYVLKCDILKYFPSIPHQQLKNIVLKHFKDQKLKNFVEVIIDSYHTRPEYLEKYNIPLLDDLSPHEYNVKMVKTGRGIPIGNQTSQIFGMYYLDKVDRYIKEVLRIKIYSRYMDDFVIVHEDKKYLEKAKIAIEKITSELGLILNSKTQIFPLKNGLVYLGFRYQISASGKLIKRVSKKTISRFKAKARLLNKAYADDVIDLERVRSALSAYHGHLKHGNCFNLEQNLFKRIKIAEIYKEKLKKEENKMTTNEENENLTEDIQQIEETTTKSDTLEELKNEIKVVARKPFVITALDPAKEREKEMAVFTKTKKLTDYVFVMTEKAPAKYRWSIVDRIRNTSIEVVENLYRANFERGEERLKYQKEAGVQLHLLNYFAGMLYDKKAISFKRLSHFTFLLTEARKLLAGWTKSTNKQQKEQTTEN